MANTNALAILAGINPKNRDHASAPTNLHVLSGEVYSKSEEGRARILLDGLVFSTDDNQWIEVDSLGGLEEGDTATILLAGEEGKGMTPLALGTVGGIDRIVVRVDAIEADYVKATVLDAQIARIDELEADTADISTLVAQKADITDLTAAEARIDAVEADTAKIHNLTANQLSAATGYIADLTAGNVTAQNIIADKAKLAQLDVNEISADHATIESLDTTYATITNLNSAEARIDTIESDYLKAADMTAEVARVGTLLANKADVDDLEVAEARIDSLEADHVTVADFQAEQGYIDQLQANTADIATIRANAAKVQNLTAAQLEADHATIGTLDTTYMHANMSNSDVAWISNGVIANGAISSAMINDVSANKLTAGTINGSVINVTNLNADNITAGTINGQRIGEGSLSLSKLEDDVYTEAEVDAKLSTMQAEIDGAIETWTGTAVPTLQNAPASGWTTTEDRDRHVGDVYFVVNSQSQQNGYNYRFTKSGSTYSWQLIKDTDITNALQRLTTAEGKITTFDSDISTLKTDTGTLTTKTQSLETSLGDKADITTVNEISDTVDGHTQSITQLSNTTTTALQRGVEYINGTQTASTGSWTGVTTDSALYTGKTIAYRLPYAGNGSASLQLKDSNGNNVGGNIAIYMNNTRVNTHYPANTVIKMTYDGTYWRTDNYDSNNYDRERYSASVTAAAAIAAGRIGVFGTDGKLKLLAASAFDMTRPILYVGTEYKADALTQTNNYVYYGAPFALTNTHAIAGAAAGKAVYIVGTISNNVMTPTSTVLTCTEPSTADGYFYLRLGTMATSANAILESNHPLYAYIDGKFQQATPQVVTTVNKVSEHTQTIDGIQTRIGSLETTVESKADGSTVTTISNKLNTVSDTVDGHTQSISNVTTIANGVRDDFDNLEIGGRNLFSWPVTGAKWGDEEHELSTYQNRGSFTHFDNSLQFDPSETVGEQYTISFWARSPNGETPLQIYNCNTKPKYFYFDPIPLADALGDEWEYFSCTITNAEYTGSETPSTNMDYWRRIEIYAPNAMGVLVKKIKVEKGNKATDWTPAPEDIETELDQETALRKGTYATSTTASSTAAKVATITPAVTGFELYAGCTVTVRFNAGNTVAAPTLNVNGTGAKNIVVNGTTTPSADLVKWNAYATCTFVYSSDGHWRLTGTDQNSVRVAAAETSITQNANQIALRATKTEVFDTGNMLKDTSASDLTKVYGPSNRYWSDAAQTSVTPSFVAISDSPEPGITHAAQFVCDGSNTSATQRGLAFYSGESTTNIPMKEGQTYAASWWARRTSGSGRTRLAYRSGGAFVTATRAGKTDYDDELTTEWKQYTRTFTMGEVTDYNRVWFYAYFPASTAGMVQLCGFKIVPAAYATAAELKVQADSIDLKVSKNDVINQINVSTEGATISASKVNIEGAAIFSSGRLSQTSLNNAYDAKGAASTAETNAKAYTDSQPSYVVFPTTYSYTLGSWLVYAEEGYQGSWSQVKPVKVGDTVLIKGTASDTSDAVYVLVTVDAVNSSGSVTKATSHGLIDPNAGQRVQTNLDNLEIGGRNLLYDTSDWSKWAKTAKATAADDILTCANTDTSSYQRANGWFIPQKSDVMDSEITVSFDAKKTDATELSTLAFEMFTTSAAPKSVASGNITEGTRLFFTLNSTPSKVVVRNTSAINASTWTRVSVTFVPSQVFNTTYTEYTYLALYVGIRNVVGSAQFRHIKAEFGNKPTDWTPAPEDVSTSISAIEQGLGGFDILWNRAEFATDTNAGGECYLCAYDPTTATRSNANGWAMWNGTKRTITKGMFNPNAVLPYNIPIYIVCRLSSDTATTGTNYMVWYDTANSKWRSGPMAPSASTLADWTWAEATDMILGKFVEPGQEQAFTECETYRQPIKWGSISTDTVTARSANAAAAAAQTTANNAAPKANAVKRTQRIWYRSNSATKPSTPGTASSNWVTKEDDGNLAWTKMHVAISSTHKYIYTCEQYELASGTVGYTAVLLDNTITVIDGGNIITGSVTANKLNAADINASNSLTIGALSTATQDDILNSNVVIGGRNLLPWSSPSTENLAKIANPTAYNSFVTEDGYGCYKITSAGTNGAQYRSSGRNLVKLSANTTYTYSAWVKVTTTGSDTSVLFNFTSLGHFTVHNASSTATDNTHEDVSSKRIYSPASVTIGEWTRIVLTFTTNSLDGSWFGVYPKYNLGDAYTVYIRNQKLEVGTKATDWTLAPEDVDADISAAQSTADGAQSSATTANNKIAYYNRRCQVGQSTTANTSKPWYKVASCTINAQYQDRTLILDVFDAGGFVTGDTGSQEYGRLYAHFRANAGITTIEYPAFIWQWRNGEIDPANFVMAYKVTSGTKIDVELWCKCPKSYAGFQFVVIHDARREELSETTYWTLYDTWTNGSQAAITSGYTQVASVDASTGFITRIDDAGITVHPSGTTNNRVAINANGMQVYKGNVDVASYGDTARIGKANSSRFLMNADSLQAYNSSNTKYFEVSESGMTFGTNTVATTQNVTDAVNDISVGGRNLLAFSSVSNKSPWTSNGLTYTWGSDGWITVVGTCTNTAAALGFTFGSGTQTFHYLPAGIYTLSVESENLLDGTNTYMAVQLGTRTSSDTTKYYTLYNSGSVTGVADLYVSRVSMLLQAAANGKAYNGRIRFKLERGNKATDWTPAPEDVDESITDAESNAKSYADDTFLPEGDNRIWYATCDTDAATVAKVATITPTTTKFTLAIGQTVNVKFANLNSADRNSITLSVNGTTAKGIRYTASGGGVAVLPGNGYLAAGRTYQFVYDGTYWVCQMNYNTNDVDRKRVNNAVIVAENVTAYSICGRSGSGHKKLASGLAIDLTYPIAYLWAGNISGQSYAVASGGTSTAFYTSAPSVSLRNTKANWSGTQYAMCYIKGTLEGKTFTVHSDIFTTTVPTSNDGYAYIPIGMLYSTYQVNFDCDNTVYAFRNGAFQKLDTVAKYITAITDAGIRVHAKDNPTTNYAAIDADGMDVVKGGVSVAQFGEETRIGQEADGHISLNPYYVAMTSSLGVRAFEISSSSSSESADRFVSTTKELGTVTPIGGGSGSTVTVLTIDLHALEPFKSQIPSNGTFRLRIYRRSTLTQTGRLLMASMSFEMSSNGSGTYGKTTQNSVSWTASSKLLTLTNNTYYYDTAVLEGYSYTEELPAPHYIMGIENPASENPGPWALTIGKDNIASGSSSIAEGNGNVASGEASHAEGDSSVASGKASHAEGKSSTASGIYSHAEGEYSTASGLYSHAEGSYTTASSDYAHAEGCLTVASGEGSHAQNYSTRAAGGYQTAMGYYNNNHLNGTALEIGNGTDVHRSNAMSVEWTGKLNLIAQSMPNDTPDTTWWGDGAGVHFYPDDPNGDETNLEDSVGYVRPVFLDDGRRGVQIETQRNDTNGTRHSNPVTLLEDPDGNAYVWLNRAAWLRALGICAGYKDNGTTVAKQSYLDVTVSYGMTYSSIPFVIVGLGSQSNAYQYGLISVVVMARTTTGFTARIYNADSTGRVPDFYWIAIGNPVN